MRSPWLAASLAACSSSYDLSLDLDRDTVAVGEEVRITLRGTIDAPPNASAYVSVAIEDAGASLDIPEITFESIKATPSGAAEFLDGRYSADNESPPILFSLYDGPEEVMAQWRMICGTPGEWSIFGGVRLQTAGGAPVSPNGNLRDAGIVCE